MAEETNTAVNVTEGATPTPTSKAPEKPLETGKTDVKTGIQDTTPPKGAEVQATSKHKVKVDGKEVELTIEELKQGYSHGAAANKRMQEAAKIKKDTEEFIHRLKTDPMGLLEDPRLGIDARAKAEEYLLKKMEFDSMSPAEKELTQAKLKLAEVEAEKKAQEKAKQDAELSEMTKKYTEDYTKDILDTLKASSLPKTEHSVRRIAYYMHQGLLRGYELKAADVVQLVKDDYENDVKALLGEADGETLMKFLGDGATKKLSEYQLSKLKQVGNKVPSDDQGQKSDSDNTGKIKKLTKEEWRKRLDDRVNV